MDTHSVLLSQKLQTIQSSVTLAISQKAAEMRANGIEVISLSAGEPDFDTDQLIKDAAIDAIHAGLTKYTAVDGIPGLKKAVASELKTFTQIDYDLDQIIVSNGAKQALYNLTQALLRPGDEVIFGSPYWLSYPAMIDLAEGKSTILSATKEHRYLLQADMLAEHMTNQTKLIILNSPSNPTGQCYHQHELEAIANCLRQHPSVWVVCDDIYRLIDYRRDKIPHFLHLAPDLVERTIIVDGVSKAFSMTGWRIGYAAGPKKVIQACKKIQSHSTSNPCSISQYAAIAALTQCKQVTKQMTAAFQARRDKAIAILTALPHVSFLEPEGAFYFWLDVTEWLEKHPTFQHDDVKLADWLLETARIAVVPGTAFGAKQCLRISFALAEADLIEALHRLKSALENPD